MTYLEAYLRPRLYHMKKVPETMKNTAPNSISTNRIWNGEIAVEKSPKISPIREIPKKSDVADPGCSYRISDPNFSFPDPGSKRSRIRIRITEFKYFWPEKLFLSSRKNYPGCSSLIPDPGSRFSHLAPNPGSWSATLVYAYKVLFIFQLIRR